MARWQPLARYGRNDESRPDDQDRALQLQAIWSQISKEEKRSIYFFTLVVVFLLPPFHFVLRMQRELQSGRHRMAFELLSGGRLSIAPRGIFFPRFWVLVVFFVVIVIVSIYLHTNLMDHLKPAPYMNLFSNLILTRLLLYYALAGECLFWYSHALNELKRECMAAERVSFKDLDKSRA